MILGSELETATLCVFAPSAQYNIIPAILKELRDKMLISRSAAERTMAISRSRFSRFALTPSL